MAFWVNEMLSFSSISGKLLLSSISLHMKCQRWKEESEMEGQVRDGRKKSRRWKEELEMEGRLGDGRTS